MFANVKVGIAELESVFAEAYECFVGMRNMHMQPITSENIGEIYGELSAEFTIPRPKYDEELPSHDAWLETAVAEAKKHLRLNIVPVGCLFKVPTHRVTDAFIEEVRKVASRDYANELQTMQRWRAEEAMRASTYQTLLERIRRRELTTTPVVGKRLIADKVEYLVMDGPKVYLTDTEVHVIYIGQRVEDCTSGRGTIVFISEDANIVTRHGW